MAESTTPIFNALQTWTEKLKISLMANFSATFSASDWLVSPYNSGTEEQIEVPQVPEDRGKERAITLY